MRAKQVILSALGVLFLANVTEAASRRSPMRNWKAVARTALVREARAYVASLPIKLERPSYSVKFADAGKDAWEMPQAKATVEIRVPMRSWGSETKTRKAMYRAVYDAHLTSGGAVVKNTAGWETVYYAQ